MTGEQSRKTALVVGATGVVGRSLMKRLAARDDWSVIAVSRRAPEAIDGVSHLPLDLLDAEACRQAHAALADVTHVFFAAYIERPSWRELVAPNMAMLENLLGALTQSAKGLRHVHLMHGTKWYGSHLGPFKTPAEEDDPRHMPPNFYHNQQDLIERLSASQPWSWSTARPHAVCGFAVGNPMNLVMVLAVYATISKALGLPLRHPGSAINAHTLYNVVDADVLAEACAWMATDPRCEGHAFNVTNGDVFRWSTLWPAFADYFEMDLAAPQKISLSEMMADKDALWRELVAQHGLQDIPYEQLAAWKFGDFVFGSEHDIISSTTKLRRYGFHRVEDSKAMFLRQFDELRAAKVIPTL